MERWKNKVAVVTGASSGIGNAISEKLIEQGVIVMGFARSKDKLEEMSRKLNNNSNKSFYYRVVDVKKEEDIVNGFKWVAENLGPVHILINNAGIIRATTLADGDVNLWKETFDTNFMGLSIATREAVRDMKRNNVDGHIVHINSIAGHYPLIGSNMYSPSKFAVTSYAELLRLELAAANSKIKITSVSPGLVATNILKSAFESSKEDSSDISLFCKLTELLEPEDVADSVMYSLGTPPHVKVNDIIIRPIGEKI
ncbi:hypothetical protein FQA39_LY13093 [Lamprigera yunnana]|nr:hypothetical protein FQA39_LY13093 [Lamprigera yunnana]